MSNLLVNIIAGNTEIEGTKILGKAQVGAIAKQVADATGHPLVDEKSNNPIRYSFRHADKVLDPDSKFSDCEIRNGDKLVLTKDGLPVTGGDPSPVAEVGNSIPILIVTPNSTKYEETLSVNTSIMDLFNNIISKNNLDTSKQYALKSRHFNKELISGTLASNNIPPKDTLTLIADSTAG